MDTTRGKSNPCASSPAWFLRCRTRRINIIDLHKDTLRAMKISRRDRRPLRPSSRCYAQIDRLNLESYARPGHRIAEPDKRSRAFYRSAEAHHPGLACRVRNLRRQR
ncbi:hypothetical protein BC834DRAFT_905671 [Gloeopeniophorella convolvens]|nr:hypothetical protein BC834DRAFT_905671 [Gloeopeniophorella convolvens]